MRKAKVTLTLDETLVKELDAMASQRQENRSRLVEEAIRFWKRQKVERELMEGYQAMGKENLELAEAHLPAAREVLK